MEDELRDEEGKIPLSEINKYDLVGNKRDIEIYKEGFSERRPGDEVEFEEKKLGENLYGIRAKM